jgi:hypothetical protein
MYGGEGNYGPFEFIYSLRPPYLRFLKSLSDARTLAVSRLGKTDLMASSLLVGYFFNL